MGNINRSLSLFILICSLFAICAQFPTSNAFPQSLQEIGRRLRRYIINDHEVTVNVEWLTDEQLSELGTLDSPAQVAKIREFYENLVSSEERKAAANKIVSQCYDWLPEVTTEAERTELKRLHRANHTECRSRIGEYISRLAENRQKHLRKFWSFCEHVSNDTTRYSEHMEGGEIPEDESENMDGLATEPTVTSSTSTSTNSQSTTPSPANHQQHRRHLINPKRFRRSHNHHHSPIHDLEECFKAHLSWLDESQKTDLRKMKTDGKTEAEIQTKVFEFYEATTGETKAKATELLKGGCVDVFKSIFGEEKYEEVKKMKEAGNTIEEISNKMTEYLTQIQDENKKAIAKGFSPYCKKLFTTKQARRRRNIHDHEQHHDLADYYKTHLSWLNEEQKEELKALKEAGKGVKEMKAKIQEYYAKTTGETKTKATVLLKAGCTELFKNIFGEEKYQEVKKLKESGTPVEEIVKKVDEFVASLQDENKKAKAKEYGPNCQKLFTSATTKKRRNVHSHYNHHTLEEYFKTHLSWLTGEQKAELGKMKKEGKERSELQQKITQFYEESTGETKQKATKLLKDGCVELFKVTFGEEKFAEVKKLKESGTTWEGILKKVDESAASLTDEHKKILVKEYGPQCRKLFGAKVETRKRRHGHHGNHSLDDYFKTHLSWLTDEQKEELKAMKNNGKGRVDLQQKVMKFYEAATGETKDKATELLKSGCSELFKAIFGEEKFNEVKKLKENGTPLEKIVEKVAEFAAGLKDEHQKSQLKEYQPHCKAFFGIKSTSRRRRHMADEADHEHHHEHHTLQDYLKTHLSWLSDAQKEELSTLKASGKDRLDLIEKVEEYYGKAPAETKEKATTLLKSACHEMFHNVFGDEKLQEVKKMKDSGVSQDKISATIDGFVEGLTDEAKRTKAKEYVPYCRKLYVQKESRRRRNIHDHEQNHNLADYYKTHLSWLNEEQKEELKALKEAGKGVKEMKAKIQEYYAKTTGETKTKATELLKAGCTELFENIFGEEKYQEVKKLKESGTPVEEIVKKVDEFVASLQDENKKAKAKEYGPNCQKLFTSATARKRRNIHRKKHRSLLDYFETHLSWLTEEQKEKLWSLEAMGFPEHKLHATVQKYYQETTGEKRSHAKRLLKSACVEFFTSIFGHDNISQLKQMSENGTSTVDIITRVDELIDGIEDEDEKQKAQEHMPPCRDLLAESQSRRR